MKHRAASWWARWRGLSLAARTVVLTLIVVLLYAMVAPAAWSLSGSAGLAAAAAAAGICLLGAALALVVSHLLQGPKAAMYGLLLAMVLRMGIPMVFALVVHLRRGALAEAGMLYYLLVFYPVTLGVETALSLPETSPPNDHTERSQDLP